MKILQVCPRYFPFIGGIEEHVRNISERLTKKYEVTVLTTDPTNTLPKKEIFNKVKIIRCKAWAPQDSYFFSREMYDYLKFNTDNFDILHAHSYHAFPSLYTSNVKKDNKFIFTPHYHGKGHTTFRNILHIPYRLIGKKIFEKADKIICVSNYEKSLVIRNFDIKNDKFVVIPNGINIDEFKGIKKKESNVKRILYVGRIEKYKGVQYIIKSLKNLEKNIFLEIIGSGSYKKNLINLSKNIGVKKRIFYYERLNREELIQKYYNADLFITLSRYEAYGMTVAEALASKTPCIVLNTSSLSEWIDNENCFAVNYPINIEELVRVINHSIEKKVKKVSLPDWDYVTKEIRKIYVED